MNLAILKSKSYAEAHLTVRSQLLDRDANNFVFNSLYLMWQIESKRNTTYYLRD
ncbi:hypothetical protein [Floridanema evergladense]|uniref:Uncharacterized protein n=1 Tax=Floridaenema evergladense BLCC-F167 TaxID=3153639 RepID=A0ABV4WJM1_9CYAN